MTRAKKEITKKKSTLYMWLRLAMLLLVGLIITMYIVFDDQWRSILFNLTNSRELNDFLPILIITLSLIIPILLALFFNVTGANYSRDLIVWKNTLNFNRDLIRVSHFFHALKNDNYKIARNMYNQIQDSDLIKLCNGVLSGISLHIDIDDMWGVKISHKIEELFEYPE